MHQTRIAKEAAAAASLLLAMHPGAASSNSATAGMPASPRWLLLLVLTCCGTGSPTTFTLDEDDISLDMMSPRSGNMLDSDFDVSMTAPVAGCSDNSAAPNVSNNHPPDFKTEFHPCSKHPTFYQSFGEFSQQQPSCMTPDSEPWHPFTSEGNYIFAMIAVEAGLSAIQVDSPLRLIHHVGQGTASVTLLNDAGLCTALDREASQLTPASHLLPFSNFEFTVPYKGNDVTFQVHVCPLWDWAFNLLQNPLLAPHFIWDAQCLFKYDGEKYECFYTKLWTGDCWWDIQSQLPTHVENAVPFAFILYADKT
ncbi:hypothetical protein F5141DRAFT_1067355 [Pisolithus sp. B1]|nr:hypothetical protein F5141DRAFT_1067355 [Pisolithus sp. B1]